MRKIGWRRLHFQVMCGKIYPRNQVLRSSRFTSPSFTRVFFDTHTFETVLVQTVSSVERRATLVADVGPLDNEKNLFYLLCTGVSVLMILHVTFGPKSSVADFADVWFCVQMDEHVHLQVGSFAKCFVAASEGALERLGAVVVV